MRRYQPTSRLSIRPRFAGGLLSAASAKLESPYGTIESSWQEEDGRRSVQVQIPPNSSAQIILSGAKREGLLGKRHSSSHCRGY
jgi:alpha-L-rhamnosidase